VLVSIDSRSEMQYPSGPHLAHHFVEIRINAVKSRHHLCSMGMITPPRAERFCQLMAAGELTPPQCAIEAGYSRVSARNPVARLKKRPDVQARIAELTADSFQRYSWSCSEYLFIPVCV
jgi:hypothetical protein